MRKKQEAIRLKEEEEEEAKIKLLNPQKGMNRNLSLKGLMMRQLQQVQEEKKQNLKKKKMSLLNKSEKSKDLKKLCDKIENDEIQLKKCHLQINLFRKSYMRSGYYGYINKNYESIHEKQSLYNFRPSAMDFSKRKINKIQNNIKNYVNDVNQINQNLKHLPKQKNISTGIKYYQPVNNKWVTLDYSHMPSEVKKTFKTFENSIKNYYSDLKKSETDDLVCETFNFFINKIQEIYQANYMFGINQIPQVYEDVSYLMSMDPDTQIFRNFQFEKIGHQSELQMIQYSKIINKIVKELKALEETAFIENDCEIKNDNQKK